MAVQRSKGASVLGCLFGTLLLLTPVVLIVGVAVWSMQVSHSVADAADELGLSQGPSHGHDGWYVGSWQGHDVSVAAIYRIRGRGGMTRQRSQPYLEVAVHLPDVSMDGRVEWTGEGFDGAVPASLQAGATAFARAHDDLVVADATPWPFDGGVVLVHEWPGSVATAEEVEAKLEALVGVP